MHDAFQVAFVTNARDHPMTALQRDSGVAAWRQIVDGLAGEIAAGQLKPGAQLPTESALAARFGVNRHTVRRALAVLSADGLVRATQGRGTFVEAPPLAYPIAARTRFSEIVRRGGREAGGTLVASRAETADAGIAAMLALSVGGEVLRLDTVRSADGVPISAAMSFLPLPRFAGLDARLAEHISISDALAACGVADYRRASTRVSARAALPHEAARLELAAGRTLLVVESLNVDASGVPIQATVGLFAADRVEIVIES